jgi:hypothetical protein
MRLSVALAVFACAGGTAFGQFSWSSPNAYQGQQVTPRVNEYTIDDGVAENSVGLTGGGTMTWANRFTSLPGLGTITGINIAFGTPAAMNGSAVTVGIWSDPNNDGSPADGVLLSSVVGVVSGAADTTPANVFVTFDIPDVSIPAGQNFFLGAVMVHANGQFPAAIDQTASQTRSWVGIGNGWTGTIGEIGSFGLPGNWQIRGNAIPGPGSIALLGLGGLVAARRRRA